MTKSLGKGLSSLIPDKKKSGAVAPRQASSSGDASILVQRYERDEILRVSPSKIRANPYQPRRHFDPIQINNLVASIKTHGILQPLVVTEGASKKGTYELVAGERRLRAARLASFKTVPIIVRSAGELEKLELSLIENIQRHDLNPIERAQAYAKLIDEFALTHEKAAKRLAKSRPVVSNTLRLLELPGEVQDMIGSGKISETHAIALLELDNAKSQVELAKQVVVEKMSKDELRHQVRKVKPRANRGSKGRSDPLGRSYERELESALGTRVKVGRSGKKGWRVTIETLSTEELGGVVKKIVKG